MTKIIIISLIGAVITFVVAFALKYRSLTNQQPYNGILPDKFTSLPPSSAWLNALPWAIGAFVIVFIFCWIFLKK